MPQSIAIRAYKRRTLWISAAYGAAILVAVFAFSRDLVSGPLAYVVAVLPALPIIGFFASIGRYLVDERDEYVRMLMIRQTLWASGFALSVATIWGFLESFGLAPHVEAYYLAVVWFAGLGLGACINRFTVGATASC